MKNRQPANYGQEMPFFVHIKMSLFFSVRRKKYFLD